MGKTNQICVTHTMGENPIGRIDAHNTTIYRIVNIEAVLQ